RRIRFARFPSLEGSLLGPQTQASFGLRATKRSKSHRRRSLIFSPTRDARPIR
ncbi:MAG: hypothetical protein ACKVIW_08365, partial [bacterium]